MLRQPWVPALILVFGAVGGLLWANLSEHGFHTFWEHRFRLDLWLIDIDLSFHEWVNDALMVLFFLRAAVEIKRELVRGELRSPRVAALPALAALGGMAVPVLIYLAVAGRNGHGSGWAVPIATDVAFALGILALAGPRIPAHVKLFLMTLAIADDVGGILIIATVFTTDLSMGMLGAAVGCVAFISGMRAARVDHPLAYVPICALMWYFTLKSGVHATIAGVVAGLLVPGAPMRGIDVIERVDRGLRPIVVFLVLPLFAIANTGIVLDPKVVAEAVRGDVFWGVALGLLLGKTIGITLFTFVGLRLKIGQLPAGVTRRHIPAIGALGGIGFTVSIFVADLSFSSPRQLGASKLAVLAASGLAAVTGLMLLRTTARAPRRHG